MKKTILIFSMSLIITGCGHIKPVEINPSPQEKELTSEASDLAYAINKEGASVETRYPTPTGYRRAQVKEDSFANFLRQQPLKPDGEKALYYDGREKKHQHIYDGVFDVDIGQRNLHQCADAIILLRGEYLYGQKRYDEINFNFVSGFKAEYAKWIEGYRIKVEGNDVHYYKAMAPSTTYEDFRKYMDMVMAYASTISLEKELEHVEMRELEIGHVFIQAGNPGHAIILIDMAINQDDEKIFLLAQSYMPAQQTQVLINPNNPPMSPWYSLKDQKKLITPEWHFELDDLKRFNN